MPVGAGLEGTLQGQKRDLRAVSPEEALLCSLCSPVYPDAAG